MDSLHFFPDLIHGISKGFAAALSFFLLWSGLALAGPLSAAENSPRAELPLNTDWRFHYGQISDAEKLWREGTSVSLPHTWNAADGADGGNNYARGTGWYVRHFKIPTSWAQHRIFIQFDGANRTAAILLNGKPIGEHVGGFARFRFNLTDGIIWDGDNTLTVKVSNADDGTAPVFADFTFFGGLYRGVKLFAVDPLHVETMDHASSGIMIAQTNVSAARAELSATIKLRNDGDRDEAALVRTQIVDAQGKIVATNDQPQTLAAHTSAATNQKIVLHQPHLWNGRRDPYLYQVSVSLISGDQVRDNVVERIGVRSFSVDPHRGFFLNGEHLDLRGVSRHQDRDGKGWAISAEDDREDFALIKEIGATALRVAHYPQSQLWFDLADENGLVVWAEIPVVNEVAATAQYTDNARSQLRELIRQNYNHPAICFWGVGNETREVGESSGHEQRNAPTADRLIAQLAADVRAEDPTRLSTYASHHSADDVRNFHTDVLGFNKYFGWYGNGTIAGFAAWADDVHRRYPTLRFSMSEFGAGANVFQHQEAPGKPAPGGPWHPEEYQALLHEAHWQAMSARDYIWGKFIWNMFDFASDQRAEGEAPGRNDKGLVTYDRKIRKDAFYWYKANWSNEPVLYITGRRFSERSHPQTEIKVYSNAQQVELFLNGVSRGRITGENHIFRWSESLVAGVNHVVVRATTATGPLTDECAWSLVENKTK